MEKSRLVLFLNEKQLKVYNIRIECLSIVIIFYSKDKKEILPTWDS